MSRRDLTRDPPQVLAVGTTWAHWPIDEHVGGGRYRTRCPRCNTPQVKDKQSMTKQSGCTHCTKRHRGSVSR